MQVKELAAGTNGISGDLTGDGATKVDVSDDAKKKFGILHMTEVAGRDSALRCLIW